MTLKEQQKAHDATKLKEKGHVITMPQHEPEVIERKLNPKPKPPREPEGGFDWDAYYRQKPHWSRGFMSLVGLLLYICGAFLLLMILMLLLFR